MLTAKEYARHVDADVRTVRRWMRNGLLKFTQPKGHHARLIDSSQPRPKKRYKRRRKSSIPQGQKIKRATEIVRQADKRTAKIITQRSNPGFEKELKSFKQKIEEIANVPRKPDRQSPKITNEPRNPMSENMADSLRAEPAGFEPDSGQIDNDSNEGLPGQALVVGAALVGGLIFAIKEWRQQQGKGQLSLHSTPDRCQSERQTTWQQSIRELIGIHKGKGFTPAKPQGRIRSAFESSTVDGTIHRQ